MLVLGQKPVYKTVDIYIFRSKPLEHVDRNVLHS